MSILKCLKFSAILRKHSQGPALARFETLAKKTQWGNKLTRTEQKKKLK